MNLNIYNGIIHGSLQPRSGQTPVNYSEISHLLDNCPESLCEIEQRLLQILGRNSPVDFDADTPTNITQFLSNPNYTRVVSYCFVPEISSHLPVPQTPTQRFYHFVITAEAKRIKLRLLQSVEILKDDVCAKEEIKGALTLLARYAKNIRQQTQPNEILDFLLTQIVKLYFEITVMFDVLLTEQDYISFVDFYSLRLNLQADEGELSSYHKALHIHQAQRLYENFDAATVQNLLSQLYGDIVKAPTDNTLIAVICVLENAIFLQIENMELPAFSQMVEANFAKSVLKDKKQALNKRLNALSNPREVLTEIDTVAENFPDFPATTPEVAALLTSSITRQLRIWLAEQKEIYKTIPVMNTLTQNINAGFAITGDNANINTENSTVVGGHNNTVSLSSDLRKEIEDVVQQIMAIANVLSDEQEEIIAELQRINVQLNKNQPKRTVISSAFQTIHNVLCGVAGNIVTPFLLEKIQMIVKMLGY
jgi:hypothetical protein